MKTRRLMILGLLAITTVGQAATTYHVATNGVDDTAVGRGLSWDMPYATIGYAVGKTLDNDTVQVSNGVYTLSAKIQITKKITLHGLDRATTVIRGQYPAVTNRGIHVSTTAGATVEGFTIEKFGVGSADLNGWGGGVKLDYGTLRDCIVVTNFGVTGGGVWAYQGTISDCIVSSNTASSGGGGIYCYDAACTVRVCTVSANVGQGTSSGYGGGIYMNAAGRIIDTTISNNTCYHNGGGCYAGSGAILSNCTIVANTSVGYGGGGLSGSGAVIIYTNVIRDNTATYGGGFAAFGNGPMRMWDCTIDGNHALSFGGGVVLGTGASLVMTNCAIRGNVSSGTGAGIDCKQYVHAGLTATRCDIVNNVSTGAVGSKVGAGMAAGYSVTLDHCVIRGNVLSNGMTICGAGLYLLTTSRASIRNCLIADNRIWGEGVYSSAARGGGVYIAAASTNGFSACTIARNTGNPGAGNSYGGGIYLDGSGADMFTNCIIATNSAGIDNNFYMTGAARSNSFSYSCGERLPHDAQGNTTNPPAFINAAGSDFRLTKRSPCVNRGTNEVWMSTGVDLDLRPRIKSGTVDMGAYECRLWDYGALFVVR